MRLRIICEFFITSLLNRYRGGGCCSACVFSYFKSAEKLLMTQSRSYVNGIFEIHCNWLACTGNAICIELIRTFESQ
jgi:hypothetical protein